jgi:hypothetical protein
VEYSESTGGYGSKTMMKPRASAPAARALKVSSDYVNK